MTLSFFCSAQVTEQQFMDSMSIRLKHSGVALYNYKFVCNYYNGLVNRFDSICKENFKYKLLGKSIFQSEAEIKHALDTLNRCEWILLEQFLRASINTFTYSNDLEYTNIDLYQNSQKFKDWLIQERDLANKLYSEFEAVLKQNELLSIRTEEIRSKYNLSSDF